MRTEKLCAIVDLYCTVKGVTAATKRLHRIWLLHFTRFMECEPLVADLTDLNFAGYVEWRLEKVERGTVRGECHKLLAVWNYCSEGNRRWIPSPEVKAPAPEFNVPKALDREQLERLWEAARKYPRLVGTLPGHIVLTSLLYVLWDTSERIGAAYRIERDNIDLKRGFIAIDPKSRKGGKQGRLYKIRPATVSALTQLLVLYSGERPFAECSLNNYYQHWYLLREMADLPGWASPKRLRSSHASHYAAMGGDARSSLGHSSEVITNRHYIDPRIASAGQQPCDVLFDPAQKPQPSMWQRLAWKLGGLFVRRDQSPGASTL